MDERLLGRGCTNMNQSFAVSKRISSQKLVRELDTLSPRLPWQPTSEFMPHAKPVALLTIATNSQSRSPAWNSYHLEDVSLNIQFFLSTTPRPLIYRALSPRNLSLERRFSWPYTSAGVIAALCLRRRRHSFRNTNKNNYRASFPVCMVTK